MSLNTVEKCGDVLALFTSRRPEWGVTEMGKALAIPKSSAHSLASSLASIGLLHRTPKGQYRLGWRLCSLSSVVMATTESREFAHSAIDQLVRTFGETAHFGVLQNADVVFLDKMGGSRGIAVPDTDLGDHKPAAKIAVGKALLASRRWTELERLYSKARRAVRGRRERAGDEVDLQALGAELFQVRREFCAFNVSEDICAVGAPIFDSSDRVVGALSMSAPADRFHGHLRQYSEAVKSAAEWTSDRLGASANPRARWARLRALVETA